MENSIVWTGSPDDQTVEVWKDVVGYEGLYQISNYANLRALEREVTKRTPNGIVKYKKRGKAVSYNRLNIGGYVVFELFKGGVRKIIVVHRMVAQAFIPNPENKPQVNHINGIKTDNHVENLEWCTASENLKHRYRVLEVSTHGQKNPRSKLSNSQARFIRKLKEGGAKTKGLCMIFGVSKGTVNYIAAGAAYKEEFLIKQDNEGNNNMGRVGRRPNSANQ